MELITKRHMGQKTVYYYDEFMALDTETSHNEHYTWLSSIQVYFCGEYFLFRKPLDFILFLNNIIAELNLYSQRRLMIIIHNASYDLSYLIGYLQMYLPDKDDRSVIKRDRNNIVAYRQGGIDIRDTYALTNTSLEKFGKDMQVEHQKKVGLYDYNKLIYQDTELSEEEKEYDKYDVISLHECFTKLLQVHGDTVATVPYTSTGYVRRDTEKSCRKNKYFRQNYFVANRLDLDMFDMVVKSFAGGYAHNNRFYNDKIVDEQTAPYGIGHSDFRSMYPSELRNNPQPFGKPMWLYDATSNINNKNKYTVDKILELYPAYSTITLLRITRAKLRNKNISMPFMQRSKMNIYEQKFCLCDNGRVLSFSGKALINVDNFLLRILQEQYVIEGEVLRVLAFKNEYLPDCLVNVIDQYYKAKSDLKDVMKRCEKEYGELHTRTVEASINLLLAKQKLNGIYGMFVQNPLSDSYDIDYESDQDPIKVSYVSDMTNEQRAVELNEYYKNNHKYLPYIVGCFTTALARWELYEYLTKCIGYDNALYCDTDSIFYIKSPEIVERINALNKEKEEKAEKNHAYIITDSGKKVYYDCFEFEPDLKAFKGLHSKCYAYITQDDEFKATIAGVPARTLIGMDGDTPIYLTREEELSEITAEMKLKDPDIKVDNKKAIQNLHEYFFFNTCTGTTSNYADYMLHEEVDVVIDGHEINTFGGCVISKLDRKQIKNMDMDDVKVYEGLIETG